MTVSQSILWAAIAASITSFASSGAILLTQNLHGRLSLDSELHGAQKFHTRPVPRVGGLALMLAVLIAYLVAHGAAVTSLQESETRAIGLLSLCAAPVFFAGVAEDLTKRVSVRVRLLASFASPLMGAALLDAVLPRLDVTGVDLLLQYLPFALVLTAFAVGGVTHSINIIDGFNGLAGLTGAIILASLGYVAWMAGDLLAVRLAAVGIGALAGFLLLNYPGGRLFLGDSGAYLLGFWIAETAVLLIARNPEVSPWQVLAICAYPVIEVAYSIYRKKFVRKMSPGVPDRLHFHMLVYRRLIGRLMRTRPTHPWSRNAFTTLVIVVFVAPFSVAAAALGDAVPVALALILLQVFSYLAVYARLVRGHWCLNPAVGFGFRSEYRARSST